MKILDYLLLSQKMEKPFFNNQDYKNAKLLFHLNTILFPDSENAKNDLARIPD
jgi:hypothetical protein